MNQTEKNITGTGIYMFTFNTVVLHRLTKEQVFITELVV